MTACKLENICEETYEDFKFWKETFNRIQDLSNICKKPASLHFERGGENTENLLNGTYSKNWAWLKILFFDSPSKMDQIVWRQFLKFYYTTNFEKYGLAEPTISQFRIKNGSKKNVLQHFFQNCFYCWTVNRKISKFLFTKNTFSHFSWGILKNYSLGKNIFKIFPSLNYRFGDKKIRKSFSTQKKVFHFLWGIQKHFSPKYLVHSTGLQISTIWTTAKHFQ